MNKQLVIFVKAPKFGCVKTRLAKDIGHFKAWRFYKTTVLGLMKRMRSPKWQITLCITPDDYKGSFFPNDLKPIRQGGGDLGQRMQRVFDDIPKGPVVLIGGDIPAIEKHHIDKAFNALQNNDITFGPAEDGGYWLVGMRRTRARLSPFFDIRWSTEHALYDTLLNLRANTRHTLTDRLNDVDTGKDLKMNKG
jgi:uncharacterized protein